MNRSTAFAAAALILAARAAASDGRQFGVQALGSFRQLSHTGDTSGKVRLASLSGKAGSYAVGALAGMRGEILIWDGRVLVSRGSDANGRTVPASDTDEATLLVKAGVAAWTEVELAADMTQPEFEHFLRTEARRRGLPDSTPYPFAVKGEFTRVSWHVVTGAAGGAGAHGGSTHALGHAQNRVFDERPAAGILLGFHSGDRLEGVISHPGERFHVHFAALDLSRSGHVDEYAVRKGSKLLLPLR